MKIHYINILFFALPLNILVYNQRNHKSTSLYIPNTRSLCECELYAPANYDNDLEMKEVMDNFKKQTQERFQEYDERMKEKRMQCKEQCDKEIQKIILKDKLEKELMDKFATLQTDIQSDAIPTCICEKSIVDKVEKGCLRCAQNLGGIVAPSTGVLGEIAALAVYGWKNTAITSAIDFATEAGIKAGIKAVIDNLIDIHHFSDVTRAMWLTLINSKNYNTVSGVTEAAKAAMESIGKGCPNVGGKFELVCNRISHDSNAFLGPVVTHGEEAATLKSTTVKKAAMGTIESTTTTSTTAIIASVVTIVIIVLIMVIIYLVLRYRRKKKMKKKLQYIKLLEE